MYTVETILNRINGRGYRIKASYVKKMLEEIIKEGGKLKKELSKFANIDFTNNREVIGFINKTLLGREAIKGKTVTNTALEELFTETNNSFFQTLMQYRKSSDRFTKVCSFIKNVIDPDFNKADKDNVKVFLEKEKFGDIRIGPTAKLNAGGGISLSNPSLPFSVDDIKNMIVEYNVAIPCKSMEDVLYILNKYGDLLFGEDFLVIGATFYANMIISEWDWIPFPMPKEEDLKHMKDFRREFELDY
ncbi:hypothetical protein BTO30_16190 [Domibacillus antri]|uniref:Uncharacterized protein n=1 Tax=Domibacillus antri TaxID=1714264 RepID=A0A1Q8Q1M6_9BACI|nr:hypothetical protein [Domibacillus antri]OLN21218.1 hypothetical protein BTO30_16190 [Domibacillus antri]